MARNFAGADQLIDIMNAHFQKEKHLSHQLSNLFKYFWSTFYFHMFEKWKNDAGGLTNKFIIQYTCQDLFWRVYGVVGVSNFY